MFFSKKERVDWPAMLVVGLIVAVFITGLVALFVIFKARSNAKTTVMPNAATRALEQTFGQVDAHMLQVQYKAELETLQKQIADGSDSIEILLERSEEKMFSVRVPETCLDPHFKAAIAIRTLARDSGGRTNDDLLRELGAVINGLIALCP